jgi:hypothetical protein
MTTKRYTSKSHNFFDNDKNITQYHHPRNRQLPPHIVYKLERESTDGGTVICGICHERFTVTACVWSRRSWTEEPQYFCKYCVKFHKLTRV